MALFPLGRTCATPGALEVIEETGTHPFTLLARHEAGDWGTLSDNDLAANGEALALGGRIFSSYILPGGVKVWCITEASREYTTLLLPDEY